jgi:ATP-binding cassette subfamily B protein
VSTAQPPSAPTLRRLISHLRPWRGWVVLIVVVDLLAVPLALLAPLPLKIAVDNAIGGQPLPAWLAPWLPLQGVGAMVALAAGLVIGLAVLSQVQSSAAWLLKTWTGERVVLGFRAELFRRTQRLSMTYHDERGIADSLYRIQYDASAVQWVAVYGLAPLLTAVGTLVGIFAVMWSMDAALAVVAMAVAPPLWFLTVVFGRTVRERWHRQKELESATSSVLQEVLAGLRVVKAFGQEEREELRYLDRAGREVRANLSVVRAQIVFYTCTAMVLACGGAAALWIAARQVQAGQLTLGQLTMVMAYLTQLYAPLESLTQKYTELQSSLAGAERAFALLDEQVDVQDREGARPLAKARGEIELRDVRFAYKPESSVLTGASAHIPAGTRVGIVGRTGAGKTTLVNLITRFQDPTGGTVLLDGHDLRDLKLDDLRRQFAIVLQEPVLFSTSIGENIAYGRPDATPAQIEAAARAADAHEFIAAMPEGYATPVGERGMMLSGGQRQRIALARAVVRRPRILLLDEATSALDGRTEAAILQNLRGLGITVIFATHRVAALRGADRLVVMDGGQVREDGTPEDLLAAGGLYARLVAASAKGAT